jgi:hypothetical protein
VYLRKHLHPFHGLLQIGRVVRHAAQGLLVCAGQAAAGVPGGREHSLGQLIDSCDGCFGLLRNRCFRHREQILSRLRW